jgi:hypothetical protein
VFIRNWIPKPYDREKCVIELYRIRNLNLWVPKNVFFSNEINMYREILASEWQNMSTWDSMISEILVRKWTIPTERSPHVGEVSSNFSAQSNESPRPYSRFSRPEPLLFLPSSSSLVLTRLSGPCSRPTTSKKIW